MRAWAYVEQVLVVGLLMTLATVALTGDREGQRTTSSYGSESGSGSGLKVRSVSLDDAEDADAEVDAEDTDADADVSNQLGANDDVATPSRSRSQSDGHGNVGKRDQGYCELEVVCRNGRNNSTRTPVTLPIQGPPGPPGVKGEKGEKGDPGEAGVAGKNGRNATVSRKVAFMAGLSKNMGHVEEDVDVIFDNVVTNVGDAYDLRSGRFTAPVDGVYKITVNIAAQGKNKAAVKLMHNATMVFTVWSESLPMWGTASNTAIMSMRRGDQIWLQTMTRFSYLHGFMYSTFTGYLLFEND